MSEQNLELNASIKGWTSNLRALLIRLNTINCCSYRFADFSINPFSQNIKTINYKIHFDKCSTNYITPLTIRKFK